ncbi:MAG: DUF2840 domain-containing protein [Blastomonas fulva]|uniref:DUF2840 domain-containing protein n=2 Tax=Alphaproteobacteria TaxID=28211 RepID=UPI004033F5F6
MVAMTCERPVDGRPPVFRTAPAQDHELGIPSRPPGSESADLCQVELYWNHGACEHWLRFGKPVATCINAQRRRVECYAPGQTFAVVRWASHHQGTVLSRIDVLQAVGPRDAFTDVPDISPGAKLLLSVRSWRKVRRVLALIDAIEELGIDPCAIPAACWRDIHFRLSEAMLAHRRNIGIGHASLAQKTRAS